MSGQRHALAALYPRGKTRYPLYRKLGGPQGRSGRAENLARTGIRSPDRPKRSQSLYSLSYPTHIKKTSGKTKNKMEGRRPEEHITDHGNKRMEETSRRRRRMEASAEGEQGPEGVVAT